MEPLALHMLRFTAEKYDKGIITRYLLAFPLANLSRRFTSIEQEYVSLYRFAYSKTASRTIAAGVEAIQKRVVVVGER